MFAANNAQKPREKWTNTNCKQNSTTVGFCRMRVFKSVFEKVSNFANSNLTEFVSRDVMLHEHGFVLDKYNRKTESYGKDFSA